MLLTVEKHIVKNMLHLQIYSVLHGICLFCKPNDDNPTYRDIFLSLERDVRALARYSRFSGSVLSLLKVYLGTVVSFVK